MSKKKKSQIEFSIAKSVFIYHGRYWYLNIKEIPRYFKAIIYLLKHKRLSSNWYDIQYSFRTQMRSQLKELLENHHSYPYYITDSEWEDILANMIYYLDMMDEGAYDNKSLSMEEITANCIEAKDNFFRLFSQYYFDLWD